MQSNYLRWKSNHLHFFIKKKLQENAISLIPFTINFKHCSAITNCNILMTFAQFSDTSLNTSFSAPQSFHWLPIHLVQSGQKTHNSDLALAWSLSRFLFQNIPFDLSVTNLFIYTAFLLLHAKLRSAHASMAQIAVVLQSNCEWGTCSRSLHSNCLGRGPNPYSPPSQADCSNQSVTEPQDNYGWSTCPRLLRSGLR